MVDITRIMDGAEMNLTQIALHLRSRGFVKEAAMLLFIRSVDIAFNQEKPEEIDGNVSKIENISKNVPSVR